MERHSLSKEQKAELIKDLGEVFGRAHLRIDGFLIYVERQIIGHSKVEIAVYVDGVISMEWFIHPSEFTERFYRPSEKFVYSKKMRDDMLKLLGKKRYLEEGFEKKFTVWNMTWKNARSFISHLEKKNQSIELLAEHEYHQALQLKKQSEVQDG